MRNRCSKTKLGLVCTVLSLSFFFSTCGPPKDPNYTVPDQIGNMGLMQNDGDVTLNIVVNKDIPNPIACDEVYYIKGAAIEELVETVCTSYNYGFLYDEALYQAESRIQELTCPQPAGDHCGDIEAYIVKQKLSCDNELARAEIVMAFRCYTENETPTEGLKKYRIDEIETTLMDEKWPGFTEVTPHEVHESEVRETPNAVDDCPARWDFRAFLKKKVDDCDKVTNYKPYVDMARAIATRVHARTRCFGNCQKLASYTTTGIKWVCVEDEGSDTILVGHIFNVYCVAPE